MFFRAHNINSVECVKNLHERFGGGFVFAQVMQLRIRKSSSFSICATEKILWYVPLIQMVPFSFNLSLHKEIH